MISKNSFSLLIPRMSTFTLAISLDHFQFALIHGPDVLGSYAILLFTALDLASITSKVLGEFNSDEHYIYYCGQESLRRNGGAIMVNRRVQNAVLGCSLKNERMISVRFQGKPFNITVIQVYAPTSNAEEAEVERFYEDLQDLLELTVKKDVLFIIGDWNAKVGSQETPGVTGRFGLGI